MAISTDWVKDAATEIAVSQNAEQFIGYFYAIIDKHCPFEYDTAYEPYSAERADAIKNLKAALAKFDKAREERKFINLVDLVEAARVVVNYGN